MYIAVISDRGWMHKKWWTVDRGIPIKNADFLLWIQKRMLGPKSEPWTCSIQYCSFLVIYFRYLSLCVFSVENFSLNIFRQRASNPKTLLAVVWITLPWVRRINKCNNLNKRKFEKSCQQWGSQLEKISSWVVIYLPRALMQVLVLSAGVFDRHFILIFTLLWIKCDYL